MSLTTATLDGANGASRVSLSIRLLTNAQGCVGVCVCVRVCTFKRTHSFVSHDNCFNLFPACNHISPCLN